MVEEWVPPTPRLDADLEEPEEPLPPELGSLAEEGSATSPPEEEPEGPTEGGVPPRRSKKARPAAESGAPPWSKRILADLPLIIVGAVCFVGAFFFFSHGAGFGNRVYPVWVLFVALGSIATTGGLASIYVGPDPPVLDRDQIDLSEFVVISKQEWNRTRSELDRLRKRLGLAIPAAPAASDLATSEDASHASLLAEVEGLGGGSAPPPAFAQPLLPSRGRAAAPGPSSSLLPRAIVGHAPSEAPGAPGLPEGATAPSLPSALDVAVPAVPRDASPAVMKSELDRQIQGAMTSVPSAAPPARAAPVPSSSRLTLPPTPPPPRGVPSPPAPVLPVPAPTPPPSPPAPPADEEESFNEEAGEPRTSPNEIEDLAKRFGALVSPSGFLDPSMQLAPPAPATTAAPPKPAAPGSQAPNTWYLPNLRALRPWPGSGRFEWEMASLRISIDYCIARSAGEEPEAFMDRAELLLQQGIKIPAADRLELDRAFALFSSLLQAYRHLTTREIDAFSAQVRPEVERIGRAIGFPLRPGEDLVNFAQHMQGVLAVFESTGVKPVSDAAPSVPSPAPPEAPKRTEAEGIDEELDRLMSEVDKHLPAGSAPVSSRKKSPPPSDPPEGA